MLPKEILIKQDVNQSSTDCHSREIWRQKIALDQRTEEWTDEASPKESVHCTSELICSSSNIEDWSDYFNIYPPCSISNDRPLMDIHMHFESCA